MTDLAKLAAGLTEAQRDATLRGGICDHTMGTVRAMLRKGLMYLHIDSPNGRCGTMELTDLGQALRRHLLDQEKKG